MTQNNHTRRTVLGLFGAGLIVGGCRNGGPTHSASAGSDRRTSPDGGSDPNRPTSPSTGQFTATNDAPGVRGTVVNAAGQPVRNVLVKATGQGSGPSAPELAVFTDEEGHFHWPLQPGRYRLMARTDEGSAGVMVSVPVNGDARIVLVLR